MLSEEEEDEERRRRLNNITSMSLKLKSTLDPKKNTNLWNASDLFGPQVISFTQKDRCGK